MPKPLNETLTRDKALIFRITHRLNLPWIFQTGLHCRHSEHQDPEFVSIGNPELIDKRQGREVPIGPGGTLDDYIPFYFTPYSPMLYNIHTGYAGIKERSNDDIVILVSSLPTLEDHEIQYVFTDRHAYLLRAEFFSDRENLDRVDFDLLQQRDFQKDPEDPGKFERYQAEALVHKHLPVEALLGVCCYSQEVKQEIEAAMTGHGVNLKIVVRPGWYFR